MGRDVRGCIIVVLLFAVFVGRCFRWSLLGNVFWDRVLELGKTTSMDERLKVMSREDVCV